MHDPKVFWLVVTNVVLGAAVVLFVLGILTGVLCDLAKTWIHRHAAVRHLDREMESFFHDRHAASGRHSR